MGHYIVIGGGIAGLTAANALASSGSVTLLEKSHQLGGRGRTLDMNGYRLNLGPHALVADGIAARAFREWDLAFSGGNPASGGEGRRAIVVRDNLHYAAVNNFASLFTSRLFSISEKFELARLLVFTTRVNATESESVNEWLHRRVRSERVREYLLMALRTATYSLEFDHLSAKVALRQLASTIKPGVFYLNGGWQTIVDGLARRAESQGVTLLMNAKVDHIRDLQADGIVIATDRQTAQRLSGLTFEPSIGAYAACLDLCLAGLPPAAPTVAFAADRPLYYSVHSAVADLAPPNCALVHVMKYLSETPVDPKSVRSELEEFADTVMPGWRTLLRHDRFLPHLMVTAAIPTTAASSSEKLSTLDRVAFAGEWLPSKGLLVDAAVSSALEACASLTGVRMRSRRDELIARWPHALLRYFEGDRQ
jgi:phytoene dehydrogenase-like protein